MLLPNEVEVKHGTFLYAGQVMCDIRVLRAPARYGSGDYEDPLEWSEDKEGEFYYLEYGSTIARGEYTSRSAAFETVEAALHHANALLGPTSELHWEL